MFILEQILNRTWTPGIEDVMG